MTDRCFLWLRVQIRYTDKDNDNDHHEDEDEGEGEEEDLDEDEDRTWKMEHSILKVTVTRSKLQDNAKDKKG